MIQRELEMNILKFANELLQLKPPPMIALAKKRLLGVTWQVKTTLKTKQKKNPKENKAYV